MVHLLGTRHERKNGQTRFEQSGIGRRVHKTDRAYSMGALVQSPRQVEAPAASLKVPETGMTEYHESHQRFMTVCQTTFILRPVFMPFNYV